jgi:hypothetical protein
MASRQCQTSERLNPNPIHADFRVCSLCPPLHLHTGRGTTSSLMLDACNSPQIIDQVTSVRVWFQGRGLGRPSSGELQTSTTPPSGAQARTITTCVGAVRGSSRLPDKFGESSSYIYISCSGVDNPEETSLEVFPTGNKESIKIQWHPHDLQLLHQQKHPPKGQ